MPEADTPRPILTGPRATPVTALAFGAVGDDGQVVNRDQPFPVAPGDAYHGVLRPFRATATLTRPADTAAYAIGDLIANSTTAASVLPLSFSVGRFDGSDLKNPYILVTGVRLIASVGTPAVLPRLSLYAGDVPFAAAAYPADNAPLRGSAGALTAAALALEQVVGEVTSWTQAASGLAYADLIPATPLAIAADATGIVRGLLEARNAALPTSGLIYTAILRGLH